MSLGAPDVNNCMGFYSDAKIIQANDEVLFSVIKRDMGKNRIPFTNTNIAVTASIGS